VTQSDLRDEPRRAQSPIVLYTQPNAEYDKQETVVGRLLTTLDRRRQMLSTTDGWLSILCLT